MGILNNSFSQHVLNPLGVMHILLSIPYLGISQESFLTIYVRRVIESNLIARNCN